LGDSGWCYFEIDGDRKENEYTEALVDYMYDILDYGSWAGEFSANGKAIYNHETRSFEGTDYYSEDNSDVLNADVKVRIPKKLWFDTLHVECEKNYDDDTYITVRFRVKNGFLTDEHTEFCTILENNLALEFAEIFGQYESTDDYEFRGCNDGWFLNRSEAIEEGDNLVFTIDKVNIQTMESFDKDIVLEIDEDMVEKIDNKLNSTENAD
jgi:hypothetical protein